jgi:hypothetical protein
VNDAGVRRVPVHTEIGRAAALVVRCAPAIVLPLLLLAMLFCGVYASWLGWGRLLRVGVLPLVVGKPLIAARVLRSFARAPAGIPPAPMPLWTDVIGVAVGVGWPIAAVNAVVYVALWFTTDPTASWVVSVVGWIAFGAALTIAIWAFTLTIADGMDRATAFRLARFEFFRQGFARAFILAVIVGAPRIGVTWLPLQEVASPESATPAVAFALLTAALWFGHAYAYALAFVSRPRVADIDSPATPVA